MRLWAVTMVRDELDIIEQTLRHLASEGVEGIMVADNGSVDGTREWLLDVWQNFPCQLLVGRDPGIAYYQASKMTALVRAAFEHGAHWVIPFDADEIWYCARDITLAAAIDELLPKYHCLEARLYNYFPTSNDSPDPNPVRRITYRDPKAAPLPKVIVNTENINDLPRIQQGNHNALRDGPNRRVGVDIEIAHFPWRSPEQFERKVRNGYQAYQATDLPEDMGAHWRQYGRILEDQGSAALREIWDTWFFDPELPLEHRPAPLRRFETQV